MKKFLEDLKKELKKRKVSDYEINEIIQDHTEMIREAQLDGLKDEDIVQKFGNPSDLARELSKNVNHNPETTNVDGYSLQKSFPINGLNDVSVLLVADDLRVEHHESEHIEVYFKKIKNPDDYEIIYDNKELLVKVSKKSRNSFFEKSGSILVKLPTSNSLEQMNLTTVSGDVNINSFELGKLLIKATSGDMDISNIAAKSVKITTVSGDAKLRNFITESCDLSSVSGDFIIDSFEVENDFDMNSVSGDFNVNESICNSSFLKTVSGDINGTNFYPVEVTLKSVSGDIIITNDDDSKEITIKKKKTVSGDIKIK